MTEWNDGEVVHAHCHVIYRVADRWGGLSNMHNDFPLVLGKLRIKSSEALYQACRFPHQPTWQQEILDAPLAFAAKLVAKKEDRRANHSRPDFDQIREKLMRWVLRLKLTQHPQTFGRLLLNTQNFPIVEQSRTDPFWGALKVKDARDMLQGENKLGRLLMELRTEWRTWVYSEDPNVPEEFACPLPDVSDLNILSRPVSQWIAQGE